MAIDNSELIRAGLQEQYHRWEAAQTFWGNLVQWSWSWIAITVVLLWGAFTTVSKFRHEHAKTQIASINKQLEEFLAREETSLLEKTKTLWPKALLIKQGAEMRSLENGLVIYSEKLKTGKEEAIEFQIRTNDDEPLAHAYVMSFGSKLVWPFDESDGFLEDGSNRVEIKEAISNTGIGKHIRQAQEAPVEVIGVGLESSFGKDKDNRRLRSDHRGQELINAVRLQINEIGKHPRISFRSLGLGKNTECVSVKNSDIERHQRSALVIVVNRLRNETVQLGVEEALTIILKDDQDLPIKLSKYEGFDQIEERLSGPLIFDGNGNDFWQPPPIKSLIEKDCFLNNEADEK